MLDVSTQWRNWRRVTGANRPLGKLNVKIGPPLSLYFGFDILLVFSSFYAFFGVFSGDLAS